MSLFLEYLSESTMSCTSLKINDDHHSKLYTVYIQYFNNDILAVNWSDSKGIKISHIVNLKDHVIWAYMNWNDPESYEQSNLIHIGKFKFLE